MVAINRMISDRYLIESSLGEGGMADVYLAMDTILNREVAIKILRGELGKDPLTLLRFQREAAAVSKLSHPNVVDVYDVGEFEGRHYIVMEYVHGRTLKQLISQRGALDKEEAVKIMLQLTSAVQHAHSHNIIHRDIKPQNVLLKDDGTVKIADFGIAIVHDAVHLTQNDSVLGSAHYIAPETTRGEESTHQVDIYALGIVFYELLRGKVPFSGDNPVQIAMKHLHEEVPSIREFNPTLPQAVENIIIKATAKDKALRYQSCEEMLQDLSLCLDPKHKVKKLVLKEIEKPEIEVVEEQKSTFKYVIPIIIFVGLLVGILVFSGLFSEKKEIIPDVAHYTKEAATNLLIDKGFKEEHIKYEYQLSDDVKKGDVISITPDHGQEASLSSYLTLKISSGMYYTIQDYTNMNLDDLQEQLDEYAPNIELNVDYEERSDLKPGYIISQSGIEIGTKMDPNQKAVLHLVVTKCVAFTIEDIVGKRVELVRQDLLEKGIIPVLIQMDQPTNGEEVEEGVVVKVDPQEGTYYIQEGDNTITLYYY